MSLIPFDLKKVFTCAVELGAAVDEEKNAQLPDEPQAVEEWLEWWRDPQDSHGLRESVNASQRTETAMRRLLTVLNPREAAFPRDWSDSIDLADASASARQALRTLGFALADLRGEPTFHKRGMDLLGAGTGNLWDGMAPADREAVRHHLPMTHRLWGWPADPSGDPEPFHGLTASLSDHRIVIPEWRTVTTDHLDAQQKTIRAGNFKIDDLRLANGKQFPIFRMDCKPSTLSVPSICPGAEPKLPVELRPDGDMLSEIEARFRELCLIGEEETIHWVGRQATPATHCTCDLLPSAAGSGTNPSRRRTLRQLRIAIGELIRFVQKRYEQKLTPEELIRLDRLGENVAGLTRAAGMTLPVIPPASGDEPLRPYGPASVPLWVTEHGNFPSPRGGRLWESEWRAIRLAVEVQLTEMDAEILTCHTLVNRGLDTRQVPLAAPANTPTPLREAYEAIARALFDAAELRRSPPTSQPMFEELARGLSAAWRTATDCYAQAEIPLQTVADSQGHCAHQAALDAVRGVNDACGHVMLGNVPFHRATAHVRSVPDFDLSALSQAMRRQTSRAVLEFQRHETEGLSKPDSSTGGKDRHEEKPTNGTVKDARIWLDGNPYRLTLQLREFLSFLISNPGVSVEGARRQMGWTDDPHVHKRINDLNNKLAQAMGKAPRKLHVWVEESCVRWEWKSSQNHRR
jgi:hypothetical protein